MAVASGARLKWTSDLDKSVLVTNFEKRGWVKSSFEGWIDACSLHSLVNVLDL